MVGTREIAVAIVRIAQVVYNRDLTPSSTCWVGFGIFCRWFVSSKKLD